MKFTIDENSLTSVTEVSHTSLFSDKSSDELSGEDLITLIKTPTVKWTSAVDHPEFAELRNRLESDGYIECARSYWNGDRVLKPFYLNEWRFHKNDRFPCAAALGVSVKMARRLGSQKLSL